MGTAQDDASKGSGDKTGKPSRRRLNILDFKAMEPWKRAMTLRWAIGIIVLGVCYLAFACWSMASSQRNEESYWWNPNKTWVTEYNQKAEELNEASNGQKVLVGDYVENIRSVDIKSSQANITMLVWFRWEGDPTIDMADSFVIYHGIIQDKVLLGEEHDGTTNYQLVRVNVTITSVFNTSLFPLDNQQIRIYIESTHTADNILFVPDVEHSTFNKDLQIAGYTVTKSEWGLAAHQYENTQSDPELSQASVTSEYVTAIDFQRSGFGLYFKCFIAMYGTSLWVLIMLYICGHHRVDPLGMIPGALFGTVSNIMVGAALLPDALDLGLLEFVNIWGIVTILATAVAVIQINNIRSEYGRKDEPFAGFFGRVMFYIIAILAVVGNLLLPLVAVSL